MKSGIYTITSPSGEFYVGSAVDFDQRWAVHRYELKNNIHHCIALQRAYKKYGLDKLIFEKIAFCEKQELIRMEQKFIDELKPAYNACKTAGSRLGTKHNEKTRAKIGAASRGRIVSEEARKNLSAALKGKPKSASHRASLSLSRTGSTASEATRAKLSMAMKGRPCSEVAKEKIAAAQRGEKNHRFGKSCSDQEKALQQASHPSCLAVRCVETMECFHSVSAAVRWLKELGMATANASAICKACRGKQASAYGYKWTYATSSEIVDLEYWKHQEAA